MKVAVVGYGKQGRRLASKFHELGVLHDIYDPRLDARKQARTDYPDLRLDEHGEVDALAITTPTSTHYASAKRALLMSKNVFIEKPMTNSSRHATELCDIATSRELVLMVGHNTLYGSGIKERRASGAKFYQAVRTNPDGYREDDNVVWRLLPHDVAMSMWLMGMTPEVRMACSVSRGKSTSTVFVELEFPGGGKALMYGSWDIEAKVRDVSVIDINGEKMELSEGEDTLMLECREFIRCCETKDTPRTDGVFGLDVVRVLEKIEEKLRRK